MKRIAWALLCASVLASAAWAEEYPIPGRQDARMRYLAYDPNQVVHLSTAVGATLVVGFGPKETVTAVAVTDSKDLKAMPKGNFLFFKSQEALPLQPVIVLTSTEGGEMRRYVFEITTVPAQSLAANAPGIYYSVQFTYPADEAARQRAQTEAQAAKEQAEAQARAAQLQLQAAHNQMEQQARDPLLGRSELALRRPGQPLAAAAGGFRQRLQHRVPLSGQRPHSRPCSSSIPTARRRRRTMP